MLNKSFTPPDTEPRLYEGWEQSGAFAAHPDSNAVPYTIMIPPPNVTGSLHMGHALTFTVQDTLIRWRRMQGRDALWQPGTDHAGIATQMVVERLLAAEGIDRKAMGRDKFLERVWQWKAESGGTITRQLRRLGASLDWPRERFTMDDGLSEAVREVFVTLHQQGLIYQDKRLVNWDPKFQTAISDLEVESREVRGSLWYFRYPIENTTDQFIVVATTRPETMLGDTAVAVHPEHPTLAALIGQFAILPLTGRRIPIVADTYADPEKGTGAVKITPAHDFNDFEVGRRHGLPMLSVLDREARITLSEIRADLVAVEGVADPEFVRSLEGKTRTQAREAIWVEMSRLDFLEKTEPHIFQAPYGDRSGEMIEPLLTVQWYCNAEELAKPAIAAVESGRTKFVPQQWENTFFAWMRDIQPWCISRQLWWGHRIPAWYAPDGEVFVARSEAEAYAAARAKLGDSVVLTQDEDVLDTWFSSGLWPFSTLGWPQQTPELARYYPGDVLVTGFDIIFFWVARMMMMGLHFMGDVPFRTVYIHGLVRDERGQKMSKSKGNVMDPLDLIDKFGTDALRFTIASLCGPGRDIKLGPARVESQRSFVTKLWNAARFCEMNAVAPDAAFDPSQVNWSESKALLVAASDVIAEATAALEAFRFDDYAAACYRFTWGTFCDWFLEIAKRKFAAGGDPAEVMEVRRTAAHVLGLILRLLHPVMPYVTEELWDNFGYGEVCSLIGSAWPEPFAVPDAVLARAELKLALEVVAKVRSTRTEMNVPPSARPTLLALNPAPALEDQLQRWAGTIAVSGVYKVEPWNAPPPTGSISMIVAGSGYALPLLGLVDFDAERARLVREREKAVKEVEAADKKLANGDFIARAKPEVVEEIRERLELAREEVARLESAIARIG